ncbi:helix-turn-helix domain-containing protein [Paenibacillus senegalensis]|uniref:helix-turn-helix domain-containing protein n=1 Tax=Paenibacillus senegalensis TaxID=1465766 RepID=UPI000287FB47|nr:helix-turn-helix domain-containing protein [Paenibacillus senegalensis]
MSRESYPEILDAQDIAQIMRVSLSKAYDLMEWQGFPLVRIGRNKRVGREAFFEWLDRQAVKQKEAI